MPIVLDDLQLAAAAPKAATPKFFSSKLTGSGGTSGLINETLPLQIAAPGTASIAAVEIKQTVTHNHITSNRIPMAPLIRAALEAGGTHTLAVPHPDDRFTVATHKNGSATGWEVVLDMTPQCAVLTEDRSHDPARRELVVQYRMDLMFWSRRAPEPARVPVSATGMPFAGLGPVAITTWTTSPLRDALDFVTQSLGPDLAMANAGALTDWLHDYSAYERICRQAETWETGHIAEHVCTYISEVPAAPSLAEVAALSRQLRYLANYAVPLDAYRRIHDQLAATFPANVVATLVKHNLNLLMDHTLAGLEAIKPSLVTPAAPAAPAGLPGFLSRQQLAAVTSHDPLVMVQAGAGSGKSSVILQRIAYLAACGVDPSDITVLSFTNAAADNITARNPNVGSMTIARMIHDIYALNNPAHELSSIDTIINSLEIFFPNDAVAATFRGVLLDVDKNETSAMAALNAFVENNHDAVVRMLDRIRQTSLELEIIFCYQRIDYMAEPAHTACRFLIIDEVQDNSIFEFVYLLKYVTKHAASLFVVGDASQTLFEFRAANPRALNTLEASGVFTTYQLTTNYRSRQEVLDLANMVLGELETNQIAGIQLEANSLTVPTAASFQDAITLDYRYYPKVRDFVGDLPQMIENTVCPNYVDARLAAGERVAFLAYTRYEVTAMERALERRYPNRSVASLVSERAYASDVFSKYIKTYWSDVVQVRPGDAAFAVSQGITNNLDKLTRNAGNPKVRRAVVNMIADWWNDNHPVITAWVNLHDQGALPPHLFFERLRDNLIDYEIRHNAIRQSLINQKNRERKQRNQDANADLVVSTIHGAKGLEFDHVVVVYRDDTQLEQDHKRMFYVALTRAMKTEYVLAYGTKKHPPIQSAYTALVAALERRDARNAARAAGVMIPGGPDAGTPDDQEQVAAAAVA